MMERAFLGWGEPVLVHTAKWLLGRFEDLSDVRVVVRGSRAGRRLLEKLAVEADRQKRPLFLPKIGTIARIADDLFTPPPGLPPAAPELTQRLAWMEALRCLPAAKKDILFRVPAGLAGGGRAERLLAARLVQLWSEIGGEGLRFTGVARILREKMPEAPEAEADRWEVLDKVHGEVRKILADAGWMDPAERRSVLAERGEPQPVQVVLAGVVEIRPVFLEMFRRLPRPPWALVFAPENEQEGFDEAGCLRPTYWANRSADLEKGQIYPVVRAADQAVRVAQMAKAWPGATLAVADETAVAGIREALREEGMDSHWAEGKKMGQGRVAGFLRLVADFLGRRPEEAPSWESAARLLRHPDGLGGVLKASRECDAYAEKHVPERMDPPPGHAVRVWREKLEERIGLTPSEGPASHHAEGVSAMLVAIYGTMEVNLDLPAGRMMRDSLQKARKVMAELASLRLPFLEKMTVSDFLRLLLEEMEEERVPEPARPGGVEMVGWLELAEEDSPSVVAASFHEGAVPKGVTADEFLPGQFREILGVNDNERRLARDAYALAVVTGTRQGERGIVGLVVPSFNPMGDPVKPSRLLLAGLRDRKLAARVLALAEKKTGDGTTGGNGGTGPGFGALPPGQGSVDKVSVTAFRDYLQSPRYFYFSRVLKLVSVPDEPGELSPGGFGDLLHRILGAFGRDEQLRESADAEEIFGFLKAELGRQAATRFGSHPKAAVGWQLELAEERLEAFARVQARERSAGWRILVAEELEKKERAEFPLRDPRGRVLTVQGRPDRMDWHEGQRKWRIVDVKTSSQPVSPDRAHCSADGMWRDLQMPLYRQLAPVVLGAKAKDWNPETCELVYLHLPKDAEKSGISKPMDPDLVNRALAKASEVAGQILDGDWQKVGELDPETTPEAFLALCGQAGIPREYPEEDEEE